ncbi:MAG: glutamate--tRNA ligase [Marinicaulis sp.]|nr:glutamate--tRNA ligase [Marinicaulis sp.]
MPNVNLDARPVVTRFAPSPTGYLHIGGARTALFNWLYARGRGGKFLLRIEDTDRERHSENAVAAILEGLKWLGVDWDDDPVSQFSRRDRHTEIAQELLAAGKAYKCFLTPEELNAARDQAKTEKRRFESPWRECHESDHPEGTPFAIRFKAPRDGETIVEDAVQGIVVFPNSALDDLIILRNDGGPTYNLAVVIDDHDMGVTHVIRGDDHLNNAARQAQIYKALGWPTPVFAHVPLIHGPDGKKLSKRHGALGVEAYRDMGYLADGIANYLIRLGWSHGDDEIIPRDKAVEWFDIDAVNKAPSRLDPDKLNHINAHYMAALPDEEFIDKALPFVEEMPDDPDGSVKDRLRRAAPFLKSRCDNLVEINKQAAFILLQRPFAIEGKAGNPLRKEGAMEILKGAVAVIEDEALWTSPETLENAIKSFVEAREIGFGQVGAPMRAALTAGHPSPSLGEVLYSLGRAQSLARIGDQLD